MKTMSSSGPGCINPSPSKYGPAAFVFATFNSNIQCYLFCCKVNNPEKEYAVSFHWCGGGPHNAPGSPITHWFSRASKGCASMKGFREALALMFESILISTDLFAV
jgi:hypothetical protein